MVPVITLLTRGTVLPWSPTCYDLLWVELRDSELWRPVELSERQRCVIVDR